ncbi:MAG: hypothetical protein HeimC3_15230 [Candidatus Heimdallarchaeota archaeon LC_3]|nr:MAG: hypothetical protein HeimC3_15230 [Candidatus Heimdallarchaeota archaeon LC_3]
MSYYNELREALKERAKPETQFEIFKKMHSDSIKRLIENYNCPEEEVLTTIYLSKFIITGDVTSHAGPQQRLNDEERVELILKNLIESKKFLGSALSLNDRLFLLQLTWQVAWEADKSFQKNMLTNTFSLDVLFCQVVDYLIIPLLHEWNEVLLKYDIEKIDYRWVLAEILAALKNDFPLEIMKSLEKEIKTKKITTDEFFLSGWIVCQEYINYLKMEEYIPSILPAATHLHLNDEMTFGGCIIYRKSDEKVYPLDNPSLFTSRENFHLTQEKLHDIKNLLSLDHPALSPSRYLHKNSRFAIKFEEDTGKKYQRHLYIFNHVDKQLDIGYWLIMVIQSEEINFTLLQYILQNRFSQMHSVLDLIGEKDDLKKFNVNWEEILQVWIKTFIVDLQDESKYIGHLEDYQKSQKYNFMGISEIKSDRSNHSFVYESVEDNSRIDIQYSKESSNQLFLDRVNNIFSLSDLVYLSGYNIVQYLLASEDKKVKSMRITPSELFYYYEEDPTHQILLVPIYTYNEDLETHNIVSGIFSNKQPTNIARMGKAFQSKRNLERSLRMIADSRGKKPLFLNVKERLSQAFPFPNLLRDTDLSQKWNYTFQILSGKIVGESIKKSIQKKIVSEIEKQQKQKFELLNNVVYFIIKDLIIPYQLFYSEKGMLIKIENLGNAHDVLTSVGIVDRRIEKLKDRLLKLPEEHKVLITNLSLTDNVEDLEEFIAKCITTLTDSLKNLPENMLKTLLVSI